MVIDGGMEYGDGGHRSAAMDGGDGGCWMTMSMAMQDSSRRRQRRTVVEDELEDGYGVGKAENR